MPSIVWAVERGVCGGIYIVPPVQYPDGKFYIKIGSRSNQRRYFSSLEETITWFRGDGQTVNAAENRRVLEEILPDTHFLSWQVKPCILTDTPSLKPYIGLLSDNLFVAVGGNGYGAKSSDELGRMGAVTARGGELDSIYANYDLGPY
jgi:sarcosine oxidase